jgi:SnoaL-like protein
MASKADEYRQFITAATAGDAEKARRFIAPGFRVTLNELLVNLSFDEFMEELARQREAFSDLGTRIGVMDVQEGRDRLVITYTMTVTFDGTLRNKDHSRSAPPTGGTLQIPSQDHVVFDKDGKIIELEVVTDISHTLSQMFD